MPTPIETFSTLYTTVIDAVKGYDDAAEIAKRDQVGTLCAELKRTHMTHAHDIAGLLLERGERPDADGSYMSVVHKIVLNARFMITADEESLLPGLRDGEKRLLETYDDTLREVEIAKDAFKPAEIKLLKDQRQAVLGNLGKIDAQMQAAA
ncbi:DUF2383 domain-containing protein [Roseinatronobacter monicus]|uniref:DUF2383 domain-containing protein n=1 Tax=Roseinatronobacter monicus TaxID=393481 RepID=UPI003F31A3AC